MNLYLDSSAVVKLFAKEAGSSNLVELLRSELGGSGSRLIVSRLTRVETLRSLRRRGVDVSAAKAFLAQADLIELRAEDFILAETLTPPQLRSLDALHLASAIRLSQLDIGFVTYDRQLGAAARDAGLKVLTPGY